MWSLSLQFGYSYYEGSNEHLGELFIRLAYVFGLFLPVTLSLFFIHFPKKQIVNKAIKFSLIPLATVFSAFTVASSFIHQSAIITNGAYNGDVLGSLYFLYPILITYYFALGFYYSYQSIKTSFAATKLKTKIAAVSGWSFLILAFLVNVLLPGFGIYILPFQAVLLSFIFIIPTLFAISKIQLFSLAAFSKKLFHFLLLATLFLIIFQTLKTFLATTTSAYISATLSIILAQTIPPPKSQREKELQSHITEVATSIKYFQDPEELQVFLTKELDFTLKIDDPKVFLVNNTPLSTPITTYKTDKHTRLLSKTQKIILKQDQSSPIFQNTNSTLAMPLFIDQNLIGIFTTNKNYYYKEEIQAIKQLQKPLTNFLLNHLIREQLIDEQNILTNAVEKRTAKLTDFIALTAHELRTPLSIALFQVEETIYNNQQNKQITKDMNVVQNALNQLRTLTERLFQVQQFDLKKITLDKNTIDINHLLKKITKSFQTVLKSQNKYLNTNIPTPPTLAKVDCSLLRQVIVNLINNASKFAQNITVSLSKSHKKVTISVADDGIGIKDKNKQRIFEKFQSQDSSMTLGIGLGLYICKKIVQLHNGKIYVVDNSPKGSIFKVELPLTK